MTNLLTLRKSSWLLQVTPDPEVPGAQDQGSIHTGVFVSLVLHQSCVLTPYWEHTSQSFFDHQERTLGLEF